MVDETPQSVSSRRVITRPRKANLFPEPLNSHKSLEIESYTILPFTSIRNRDFIGYKKHFLVGGSAFTLE
ncbi:hypothetical protein DYE48_09585 [Halobacillus trueperi]|uniref:Uncharacterized protein n=1 Tax=Halobacillus trueperi TaxID=156205 RepID=A0A3E0J8Q7_9BACI|nr:hypothetical protein DYE48_09585 [Halobacillus trueperi]